MASYDSSLAGANIAELAIHLVAELKAGRSVEYRDVAIALETLYETLPPDDAGFLLSAGFIEDLMHEAQARGVPLRLLYDPLGPHARSAWQLAYTYTHGGERWVG